MKSQSFRLFGARVLPLALPGAIWLGFVQKGAAFGGHFRSGLMSATLDCVKKTAFLCFVGPSAVVVFVWKEQPKGTSPILGVQLKKRQRPKGTAFWVSSLKKRRPCSFLRLFGREGLLRQKW